MARKEKVYHYIYKTTNLKTGKFYVGMHSTDNLNDGYLGSGLRLRRSIRKHGKDNFKLEILEFLPDRSSLKDREKELVNENLLKDPMCMNLKQGGTGGNIGINGEVFGGDKFQAAIKYWQIPENKKRLIERNREVGKMRFKNGELNNWKCDWTGKKHKEESKQKIGSTNSIKQKGLLNSQFGTCWITNGIENKKIKKSDSIPNGWKIGRFLK